jgi:hypothetical protein
MTTIDTESPPRAWLEEWIAGARSREDLRLFIMEQQNRLDAYVRQIEKMDQERAEVVRWQIESAHNEMILRGLLERYKSALEAIAKFGGPASDFASTALRAQ